MTKASIAGVDTEIVMPPAVKGRILRLRRLHIGRHGGHRSRRHVIVSGRKIQVLEEPFLVNRGKIQGYEASNLTRARVERLRSLGLAPKSAEIFAFAVDGNFGSELAFFSFPSFMYRSWAWCSLEAADC